MKAPVCARVGAALCFFTALSSGVRADSAYPVTIRLYSCPIDYNNPCTQPGKVSVNGIVYSAGTVVNVPAGSSVSLVAIPGSGYVFGGWESLPGTSSQSASITLAVNGALTVAPIFTPASTVSVGIMTQPAGLKVLVDDALVTGGTSLAWAWFTDHTVSAISPQRDANGKWWVFSGWNDGGTPSHIVKMRAGMVTDTLVARYTPAVPVEIVSRPAGLKVTVDGTGECVQCTLIWGIGEKHTLTAAAQQKDGRQLSYRFRNWSEGNGSALTVTVEDPLPDRLQYVAYFDRLGMINVGTVPDGVRIAVGDSECYTPCELQQPLDAAVAIKAPASFLTGYGTRLDFLSWSDGSAAVRTVKAGVTPQNLSASFRVMKQIAAAADPEQGAIVTLDPPSPDGFYDANGKVSISVAPLPGYRFDHWDGDLSGPYPGGWLTMGLPRQVTARMRPAPYLAPRSVRNAASDVHADAVTACSMVTISGIHLAAGSENVGDGLPRQFLAGAAVRMGDLLLPLYSVAPGEITAQLPCNLPEGTQRLTVKSGYEGDVSTEFTVVRNAPGLFTYTVAGQQYALAQRADGSIAGPDNPVENGESVTLFGTGFGPLLTPAPEGIVTPASKEFQLADAIEVLLGESSQTTRYAGASGPRPGMNAVQFQLNTRDGTGAVKVRVNGSGSNAVLLPVQ